MQCRQQYTVILSQQGRVKQNIILSLLRKSKQKRKVKYNIGFLLKKRVKQQYLILAAGQSQAPYRISAECRNIEFSQNMRVKQRYFILACSTARSTSLSVDQNHTALSSSTS
jgi:hypothetical protein